MGHIFIQSNGLSQSQINAVDLRLRAIPPAPRRLWRWVQARILHSTPKPDAAGRDQA